MLSSMKLWLREILTVPSWVFLRYRNSIHQLSWQACKTIGWNVIRSAIIKDKEERKNKDLGKESLSLEHCETNKEILEIQVFGTFSFSDMQESKRDKRKQHFPIHRSFQWISLPSCLLHVCLALESVACSLA